MTTTLSSKIFIVLLSLHGLNFETPNIEVDETDIVNTTIPTIYEENNFESSALSKSSNESEISQNESPKGTKKEDRVEIYGGLVSKEQFERCSLVVNVILKPSVCVAGVLMNSLGVYVLLQSHLRQSTYIYLCCLSIADIGYLLAGIVLSIPYMIHVHDIIFANYIETLLYPYVNMFFEKVFIRVSEYTICVLSIERLFAVLRPLKVKNSFFTRHVYAICTSLWLFSICFHLPNVFGYYPQEYHSLEYNATMYKNKQKVWYATSLPGIIYSKTIDVLNCYIPSILLVTCNFIIITKLYRIQNQRQKLFQNDKSQGKLSQEQKRITLTLLIISFSFLLVFLPDVTVSFLRKYTYTFGAYSKEHYFVQLVWVLTSFGWSVNAANDFIIYIFTSKKFKHTIIAILCGDKVKFGPYSMNSTSDTSSSQVWSSTSVYDRKMITDKGQNGTKSPTKIMYNGEEDSKESKETKCIGEYD